MFHTGSPQKRGPSGQKGVMPASLRSVQGGSTCLSRNRDDYCKTGRAAFGGPGSEVLRVINFGEKR